MPDDEKAIPISRAARKEAVRRIRECEKTGQTWLDLSDLALEQLPAELGQLTCLRHLALGPMGLKVIDGDRVEWGVVNDLGRGTFTDLSPLVKLTALTTLSLYRCKSVSDLGPLRSMTRLTYLDLSFCELVSDLEPLRTLTGLTKLKVAHCALVSDLGPLGTLAGFFIRFLSDWNWWPVFIQECRRSGEFYLHYSCFLHHEVSDC